MSAKSIARQNSLLRTCCALSVPLLGVTALLSAQPNPTVDSIFADWDRPSSPGCALGVVSNGDLVYSRGYGVADLSSGAPITPTTVFYLASVSKQFTASTIALLSLRGDVSLDERIGTYVPELGDHASNVTVRHMIHHVSGLRDYLTLMDMAGMSYNESYDPLTLLQLVARQEELNFPPGSEYLYSNTGYFLMPIIVERVTGRSVRESALESIFGPLGMDDTHFHDDFMHPVERRAYSYQQTEDGFDLSFLERFDQVGSGGVLSTVEDLAKWDANFYEPTVGGQAFLDLMHTRGVLNGGDTLPYAFGLRIDEYKGQRIVEHGGSMMGFKTHLARFPDQHFSVICLCNLANIDPGSLARKVADVYLQPQFAEHMQGFVGDYYSRELDATWQVSRGGTDLYLDAGQELHQEMRPTGADTFRYANSNAVVFSRDQSDVVTGFTVDAGRVRGVKFVRR